jgi:hypothetical protein
MGPAIDALAFASLVSTSREASLAFVIEASASASRFVEPTTRPSEPIGSIAEARRRIAEAEGRVAELEGRLAEVEEGTAEAMKRLADAEGRLAEAEGRAAASGGSITKVETSIAAPRKETARRESYVFATPPPGQSARASTIRSVHSNRQTAQFAIGPGSTPVAARTADRSAPPWVTSSTGAPSLASSWAARPMAAMTRVATCSGSSLSTGGRWWSTQARHASG